MKFAAIIEYSQDKAKIQEVRPSHRAYLTSLLEKGQLAASGPFTDDYGALIIYEANSREEELELMNADPFNQNGIFLQFQLRPWNAVFANRELF